MPQLDSATWLSQIVWLAISFTVLLIIMWGVALPKVRRTLEDRQSKIEGDLQEAERLRDEANAALKSYEGALAEARSKAHSIASEMSAKISKEADIKRTELESKLDLESEEAEKRISAARESALASVRDVASELTMEVTSKLIGEKPDDIMISSALDQATEDKTNAG
tara:strand:+ start:187 stop:687 length:501 start_codon:yes stop_codon:yes gene_type:complete